MSESIDYAEMLEIPVNTLNVVKKRGRKKKEEDLKNRVVERVNERLEERAEAPAQEAFAETQESILAEEEREEAGRVAESEDVTDYGEETAVKPKKRFFDSRILISETVRGKLNLIVYNPAEGSPYEAPDEARVLAFEKILWNHNITAIIRKSKGQDIKAACGQLKAANKTLNT